MVKAPPSTLRLRFQLRACLGRGSMGVVYSAYDKETGTEVAIKTLDNFTADGAFDLKQEFRAFRGISHPNLVRLYELFDSRDETFFTMELVNGIEPISYVRGSAVPGEPLPRKALDMLAGVFLQLVNGIAAIHAAGKLHRDIKPSNVLVDSTGRAVLLDFGLAIPRDPGPLGSDAEPAGTRRYMAPEAFRGEVSPALDWYSLGVVLCEALAGERTFVGSPTEILERKQESARRVFERMRSSIPEELEALVLALLDTTPERRPDAGAIRAALARVMGIEGCEVPAPASWRRSSFVGRRRELKSLRALFNQVQDGVPGVAHVSGASGIGKTDVVRAFLAEIEGPRRALVLRARCHPLEAVAYKALDGIIDDLTKHLLRLGPAAQRGCVPSSPRALIQLFPVLTRVPAFAEAGVVPAAMEPHEARRQAFEALRDMLHALSDRRQLVLFIDDVHWADPDSLALLQSLLRPPGAPSIMLVLVHRSEEVGGNELLARLAALGDKEAAAVVRMEIAPLSEEEVRALVLAIVAGRMEGRQSMIPRIAAESAGSPLFAGELARALLARSLASQHPFELRVDTVIEERLDRLPSDRRRLLGIVSIAGRPIDQSLALGAAGLGEGGRSLLYPLIEDCLLRSTTIDDRPAVAVYHDRIGEAVVASLDPAERRDHHLRLADTVRRSQKPDPQVLAEHYLQAGEEALAADYALEAGDIAARALAFDRAAEFYRLNVRLRGDDASWSSHSKLADALANAGRGGLAGQSFQAAARALAGRDPGRTEVLGLKRQAAEQFLRSGCIEEGRDIMKAVLEEFKIQVPTTPRGAVRAALVNRAKLLVRGLAFTRRDASEIAPEVLARLDAIWGAGTSITMVDYVPADALDMLHLFGALDAGEPSRALRALGLEAAFEAQIGGAIFGRRADRLLSMACGLARTTGLDYDLAWVRACEATMHWQRSEWASLIDTGERAIEAFRTRCRGTEWEIAVTRIYTLAGMANGGRIRRLLETARAGLSRATERGDRFAETVYALGLPSMAFLVEDQPETALLRADAAIAGWKTEGFNLQHYHHLLATTQALLYSGDGWGAWERLIGGWPAFERSAYASVRPILCEMAHLRGRAALAALRSGSPPHGPGAWTPASLRRDIKRSLERVRRTRLPMASPLADALEGSASPRPSEASLLWERALAGFVRADMRLYARATSLRLGELLDDPRRVESSVAWMKKEGIVDPARMGRLLIAPGPSS